MDQKLFRKVALDKLASPDELDHTVTVIAARDRVALWAVGLVCVVAVLWGLFGLVVTKVSGVGILVEAGGIANVVHTAEGRLLDIAVKPGQAVRRGQVVAKIEREREADVLSPFDGVVLEVKAMRGDYVRIGAPIFSVKPGRGSDTVHAVLYLPAEQGKKVLQGMVAQISPSTEEKDEYGFLTGNVVFVSEYPVSIESMIRHIGNRELVQKFLQSAGGAATEVKVELIKDKASGRGYLWSAKKGAPLEVSGGILCSGLITVKTQRPLDALFFNLNSLLGSGE